MTMQGRIPLRPMLAALAVAVVAVLPYVGLSDYWVRQVVLISMLALVVSGLNLSFGFAGQLALGQAAVYAAGAFAAGYLAKEHVNDLALALAFAVFVAVVVGVIAGAPAVRLGGWVLAVASFFLVLLLPDLVSIIGDPVGGSEGLVGIPIPQLAGVELDSRGFYVFAVVVTAGWFALFGNLVRSPRGAELRVIGTGEALADSLGIWSYGAKLKAYAMSAVPAGVAGTLFAYLDGYVSAVSFDLHTTLVILAAGVLGGLRTVFGAVLGAALLQLGPTGSTAFEQYAEVAFGAFLLVGAVLLPRGLAPLTAQLLPGTLRAGGQPTAPTGPRPRGNVDLVPLSGHELALSDVSKSFGGHQVLIDVSLRSRPGEVTALIGPNGSGKTTLLNVIGGLYAADGGAVCLGEDDLTGAVAWRRARRGVGRTFQTPAIPSGLTVREVVRTGMIPDEVGVVAAMLRLPSYWRRHRQAGADVQTTLQALGIDNIADEPAHTLPVGSRRLVELARALVARPRLLLLDEVASGLDGEEVDELQRTIERVRDAGGTILLVEHNFDLVRRVSDQIVVLADGKVLVAGTPDEVAADPRVHETYLGSDPADPEARSAPDEREMEVGR